MLPIDITFDNKVEDHIRASNMHYKTTVFYKIDKILAVFLLLFGIFITITLWFTWWTIIFIFLAVVMWLNLFSLLHVLRTRIWFKKNPKFKETYNVTFSEDNIHFHTKTIDSKLDWSLYSKVIEDDQIVLLMYGTALYSVIPKRAFTDENDLRAFIEYAKRKIGNKQK